MDDTTGDSDRTGDPRRSIAGGDRRAPAIDRAPGALARLETRVATLTHQIMGMERMLGDMDALGAETASAEEAIAAAWQLLALYRRRLEALAGE
jgi:hypothetical protein